MREREPDKSHASWWKHKRPYCKRVINKKLRKNARLKLDKSR